METTAFSFAGWSGEIVTGCEPMDGDLPSLVRRLADPVAAEETIHWGRNYLYRTAYESHAGPLEVVVKQFNNRGFKAETRRRLRGSKAERAWKMACGFVDAGLRTAEPVILMESVKSDGPSFLVTRHLPDMTELRYVLRAANAGREQEEFPELDYGALLDHLGRTLAAMHEAGFFHRDLSIGNVLIPRGAPDQLHLIDLNRARYVGRPGLVRRTRDLCRLAIFRGTDQQRFLTAYWGAAPGLVQTVLYKLLHHGFLWKINGKKRVRAVTGRFKAFVVPRRAHAHIPEAPEGASARDKVAWDYLSDQPHQHAGRLEKTLLRLADAPSHALQTGLFLTDLPGILRCYRRLAGDIYEAGVPWDGVGVCVRPHPEAPDELLRALDDLGVERVLLRLHPWADDDRDELTLARELHARGYELAFALPQNRDLVRDPERWRSRVEELAGHFTPYGRHFQIGQAINRSKWGVWTLSEYAELAASAAEVLRPYKGVELLGPAVIDFEYHATVAALRLTSNVGFDALASLLYVDRRGAPENTQLGFDTVGKVLLLRAIAEKTPGMASRSWITEVNWPLWEGPHSPAGRSVSVTEDSQADYLARFYLLALTTGAVERVYWWQLIARGYGLIAPATEKGASPRRRASFEALATLERELRGAIFLASLGQEKDVYLFQFRLGDGGEAVVGWCREGTREASLPRTAVEVVEQNGERRAFHEARVELGTSVRYFRLE